MTRQRLRRSRPFRRPGLRRRPRDVRGNPCPLLQTPKDDPLRSFPCRVTKQQGAGEGYLISIELQGEAVPFDGCCSALVRQISPFFPNPTDLSVTKDIFSSKIESVVTTVKFHWKEINHDGKKKNRKEGSGVSTPRTATSRRGSEAD